MKNSLRNFILAGVAGATLISGSLAVAGSFGPMSGHCDSSSAHKGNHDMVKSINSHLNELKTELKITEAQDPAWQAFTAKASKQAEEMQSMRNKMQEFKGSAPEMMSQRTDSMKQRLNAMDSMQTAMKDLYAVLTPEQKVIADKRFESMGNQQKHSSRHQSS